MKKRIFRPLVWILTVAMLLQTTPIVLAQEKPETAMTVAAETESISDDTVHIVEEDISKRTVNTKTYRRSDGSYTAAVYPYAVHYEEDGAYKDIDNTLTLQTDKDGKRSYVNAANALKVALPTAMSAENRVRVSNKGHVLAFYLEQAASTSAKLSVQRAKTDKLADADMEAATLSERKTTVSYASVRRNTSLQYELRGTALKESVVLYRKPETQPEYAFFMQADGLQATLCADKTVRFYEEDPDDPVFVIAAPYMIDAEDACSNSVTVALTEVRGGYRYTLRPSLSWLQEEERAYPVVLDPTVVTDLSSASIQAANVYSRLPDRNYGNTAYLYAGTVLYNGEPKEYRSYIKMALPESIPSVAARVVAAKLYMNYCGNYNTHNSDELIDLHRVTQGWDESTLTWNNQPAYDANAETYAVPKNGVGKDVYDITALVADWHAGNCDNNGLMLKTRALGTVNGNVCYDSDDAGTPPYMLISYRLMNGIEDYWSYTTVAAGRYGSASVNTVTGNLVCIQPICGIDSARQPVSLSMVYGATENGGAWRLNYDMKMTDHGEDSVYRYSFNDADGTTHYFYRKDAYSPWRDEDGLGLTLDFYMTGRYIVTDKDNNRLFFFPNGLLDQVADAAGNALVIGYDGTRIVKVIDGVYREYEIAYDTQGRVSGITDPAGRTTAVTYSDSSERITGITYPDGKAVSMSYGDQLLTAVTAPDGMKTYFSYYGGRGKRVSLVRCGTSESNLLEQYSLVYKSGTTEVTDRQGRTAVYQYNRYGQTTGVVSGTAAAGSFYDFTPSGGGFNANKLLSASKTQKSVTNLLKNHRLDTDLRGFFAVIAEGQTTDYSHDDTKGNIGKGSMKVTRTAVSDFTNPYSLICQDYPVTREGYYTMSAYINTGGVRLNGNGAVLRLERRDSNMVNMAGIQEGVHQTGADEWKRVFATMYYYVGDTIRCTVGTNGADCLGTMWFDDFQLEYGETANAYNLMENTDFKDGMTAWATIGESHRNTNIGANAPQGSTHGVSLPGKPSRNTVAHPIPMSGKKGDVLTYGSWGKASSLLADETDGAARYTLRLEFYKDGQWKGENLARANSLCRDWQLITGEAIAPCDYDNIKVHLEYNHNTNGAIYTLPYCYKEAYGQSYTYDENGNIVKSKDLAQNEATFSSKDNQVNILCTPTGSRYFYTYDSGKQLSYALSDNGQEYNFVRDDFGNIITSETRRRYADAEWPYGGTYRLLNMYSGEALGATALAVGTEKFYPDAITQSWTMERASDMTYDEFCLYTKSKRDYLCMGEEAGGNRIIAKTADAIGSYWTFFKLVTNTNGSISLLTSSSGYTKYLTAHADTGSPLLIEKEGENGEPTAKQQWYLFADEYSTPKRIITNATYNANGSYMTSFMDALGHTTTYDYNATRGTLQSVTDPRGNTASYAYNADNDILESVTAGGMSASYTYANDALTGISVANGAYYTLEYDAFGRVTKTKVGARLLSERIYDPETGLLTRQNYGNGQYVTYTYDALDRVIKQVYNGDETKPLRYYYGADGQPAAVSDALSDKLTRYVYDLSGRLAEKREYAGCALTSTQLSSSVRYTYSGTTGQLTDTAYTSSLGDVSMTYAYGDASGQRRDTVHKIRRNGSLDVSYTYDALGRRVSRSPGNCTTQQYTYVDDPDAPALTSTRVASVTGYYGTTEYSYDANGNITRIQNGSETQDFTYDALGQLTAYTDAGGNAYAYTYQNGNILTATKNNETYHTYAYADTGWSDLLTAFDGGAITYDNIGNPLTYHDGKTFTWTAGRRLSGVTDGESSYAYAYDGDGNRISKTVNGVTTEFVYVDGKLLGLQKGQDKLQFLYDETDTAYGFLHNGTPYYYDKNLQGDIIGIYDRNGSRVATYTYDAWGLPEFISDNTLATLNPLRYRGYFYDDETGFYYLQSRYYDPEVGRFINSDGYISTGTGMLGYNMFAYCDNNPVLLQDSTGSRPIIGGGLRDETPEQRKLSFSYISSTNRQRYVQKDTALTVEQKRFVATIAGEAIGENTKTRKAVAHTIVNRRKEPRDVWSQAKTITDVLTKAQYNAVDGPQYNLCMKYLNNRTGNNNSYEYLIAAVIPIYNGEEQDFTMGAHYIFNVNGSKGLLAEIEKQPNRYMRCGPFDGISDTEYRMYRCLW